MNKNVSTVVTSIDKEIPKRLSPTPETLRELYLLSGNKCAMSDCSNILIDGNGVVVGHICHIRAAMPDGARFDANMTNEQRRHVSNLVMLCGGHHKQIDSKQYEQQHTVQRVTKIKTDHEAKFKGIGDSLQKAFEHEYVDNTDMLNPTEALTFEKFEQLLIDCRVDPDQRKERQEQVANFISHMKIVPDAERIFMLAVIRRAVKLNTNDGVIVPTDDLKSSISISHAKLEKMGKALARYGVGDIDLYGTPGGDDYCVRISDPSDYVTWFDLHRFCNCAGMTLDEFALRLRFGKLDS